MAAVLKLPIVEFDVYLVPKGAEVNIPGASRMGEVAVDLAEIARG